jgi:two-component system OmpR family response regulator
LAGKGLPMKTFKVLVADAEKDFLETIVKHLKNHDLDVSTVDHGEAALQLIDSRDFDVVILDEHLPDVAGIEILNALKKKKPLTEVIILTGEASVESSAQAMQLGAFDYIMKPVPLDELYDKMRQAQQRKLIQEGMW